MVVKSESNLDAGDLCAFTSIEMNCSIAFNVYQICKGLSLCIPMKSSQLE